MTRRARPFGDKHLFEPDVVRHEALMASKPIAILLGGCLSLALGGCVAAVIPVAASGLIGRSKLHGHHRDAPVATATVQPADTRTALPPSSAATTAAIPPAPADPTAMQTGTAYAGALPVPGARTPQPILPAAVVPAEEDRTRTGWSDVLHYVAAASERRPDRDTLPAKGRTAEDRRWIACGAKPSAVVVNLDATTVTDAATYLRSIETLGPAILYTSHQPSAVARKQANALRRDGVQAPVAGQTLFVAPKGGTADFAARYCVLSIVGTSAKDFPSTGGSDPHRGWFLIAR